MERIEEPPHVDLLYDMWARKLQSPDGYEWGVKKLRQAWLYRVYERLPSRQDLVTAKVITTYFKRVIEKLRQRERIPPDIADFFIETANYVDAADYENSNYIIPFQPAWELKFYRQQHDIALGWAVGEIEHWKNILNDDESPDWLKGLANQHLAQMQLVVNNVRRRGWLDEQGAEILENQIGFINEHIEFIGRARGRKLSKRQRRKISRVMREFYRHHLKSHKHIVKSKKQALAIAYSEARRLK